jgi:hypothetical protein
LLGLDTPMEVSVTQKTRDEAHALLNDSERSFNALLADRDEYR